MEHIRYCFVGYSDVSFTLAAVSGSSAGQEQLVALQTSFTAGTFSLIMACFAG